MQSETTLKRHAALVDEMANARGIDLEEEILRGRMTIGDLDDAVLRCTGCTGTEACAHWLATQPTVQRAEDAPLYCRNTEMFLELENG